MADVATVAQGTAAHTVAPVMAAPANCAASNALLLGQISLHTVYLMGITFILGSLCTIFLLLILEMVRARMPALAMDEMLEDEPEEELR